MRDDQRAAARKLGYTDESLDEIEGKAPEKDVFAENYREMVKEMARTGHLPEGVKDLPTTSEVVRTALSE